MRKGFIETLATVAIATLGFNAMALAPTVGDIPDVIVGDVEDVSDNNVFVFEDAFSLDDYVTDDETDPANILWSYTVTDTNDVRYTINGVGPVDGMSQAILPGNRVDTQDNDPLEEDGDPRTVTFRDEQRSPVDVGGGSGPYPDPAGGPGVLPDSRTITMFASDGSTVGMGSFIIYSEDDGEDGFSPREEIIYQNDFRTGMDGWFFGLNEGTVSNSQDATNGLCLEVAAAGDNDAAWISPYGLVELVPNSVWEARMSVSTSQTTAFETPLWILVYDNFNHDDPANSQNEYGGEMFFMDNENGANSPIAGTGRSDFRGFMAPIAFQVPHFNDETNGFHSETLDAANDMRLQFRIFDYASASYGAVSDEGSVCFQDITVIRHDISNMQNLETVFEVDSFTNADSDSSASAYQIDDTPGEATNLDFSGGNIVMSPNGNAWNQNTVTLLRPGNGADYTPNNENGSNNQLWPIDWEADTVYYIEYELSAPTTSDEENPPDVIRIGADTMTSELVQAHFLVPNTPDFSSGSLNNRGVSMPRTGDPQKYGALFYSHTPTASTGINDPQRWRPRFEVLNDGSFFPIGRQDNTGSVEVHSVTVQKVNFQ